ncbi:MAG: ATP-binding protein [Candidatus Omnitrophota bacterium]|nr:ATP-binding protein [Candidatus Omnitrophota bacterium]
MDIRIAFTRAGIFLVVYTIVLGIPFVVLQRTGSGLLATSLAVVVASAGPLIYRFLQVKAESVILAQQHRYQKILLRTAIGMVTEHDLKKLSRLIVYILKNTIRINFSAIFIRDKKNNSYHLEAIRGESNLGKYVESFSEKDPFIGYLKKNREYFFFEEAPEQIKSSSNILFKSKVVIPALIGDELLGFVFLGEKTNGQPYSIEDINVFKILSHQAALAIENCIFFEESKDAQQRMFAAEKLASIGGMADGLAHQIKNRLNLFSLAGGELKLEIKSFLEKHDPLIKSNPELDTTFKYLHELGTSIMDNVKRTDGIIKGILDFAKVEKKENFFTVFSFKETVELSSVLLMLKHEAASLPLNVKIDSQDTIYGVKSQLTEVIYNLLDNACEAIKEKKIQLNAKDLESFSPAIELSLAHTPDRQIIKISDNGMGIKEEDKLKIFAPFFTTKSSYKSGSGIGVYVVKRIIEENHKGKIRFSSTYMEGTSFTIELPKK